MAACLTLGALIDCDDTNTNSRNDFLQPDTFSRGYKSPPTLVLQQAGSRDPVSLQWVQSTSSVSHLGYIVVFWGAIIFVTFVVVVG